MPTAPTWPPLATRQILQRHLTTAIADGGICGAVLAVGRGAVPECCWTAGHDQPDPPRKHMRSGTVFDPASLTKVIATLPVILTLVRSGQLRLDDPVTGFLPALRRNGPDGITIAQLLAHTSGLPATRRYYREFSDEAAARAGHTGFTGTSVAFHPRITGLGGSVDQRHPLWPRHRAPDCAAPGHSLDYRRGRVEQALTGRWLDIPASVR